MKNNETIIGILYKKSTKAIAIIPTKEITEIMNNLVLQALSSSLQSLARKIPVGNPITKSNK